MTDNVDKNIADLLERLGDEAKMELLEHLAEELGFGLTEGDAQVDPQSDIVEVVEGAIKSLQGNLGVLQQQFAEGAEIEYAELSRAAHSIEMALAELSEAHDNLYIFIDSVFDLDDEEDEEDV